MFLKRFFSFIPRNEFSRALDLFNEGHYRKALRMFDDLAFLIREKEHALAMDVLKELGFVPMSDGSNCFTNPNVGDTVFDFSSRQETDAITACIWDAAQNYSSGDRQDCRMLA